MPLQIRRGTEAERQAMTIPLAPGEPLFVTDTDSIWVGNGVAPGGVQVTGLALDDTIDAVAGALVLGNNQNITFVYGPTQNSAGRIDAVIDLDSYSGVITADGFKGSLLADDSGVIVDSTTKNITANDITADSITVNSLIFEDRISTDLQGNVFANDSSLLVDAENARIVGPVFSNVTGDLTGNVFSGDNTLLVDAENGMIVGPVFSDVTGDLTGNVTGDLTGNVTGDLTGNVTGDLTGNSDGFHTGEVRGSVFANDSTLLVDAVMGEIVGDVNNTTITSKIINGSFLTLLDENDLNISAGIIIQSEGTEDDPYDFLTLSGASDTVAGPAALFLRSRGTHLEPTPLLANDKLLSQYWLGTSLDNSRVPVAGIQVFVDGTPGDGILPGRIEFGTSDNSGVFNTVLSLDKDGFIGIVDNSLTVGGGSGQVNTGGTIKYIRITVSGVDYALPLYPLNP
jgi:hypothetical protein